MRGNYYAECLFSLHRINGHFRTNLARDHALSTRLTNFNALKVIVRFQKCIQPTEDMGSAGDGEKVVVLANTVAEAMNAANQHASDRLDGRKRMKHHPFDVH
jgi:hypothetical protein